MNVSERERGRRHLDHAADFDLAVERHALVVEALLRLRDHRERLRRSRASAASIGIRMLHLAVVRGAQDARAAA